MTEIKTKEDIYELLKPEDVNFQTKVSWSHPIKTNNKLKNLQLGRVLFNMLLPDDYPFVDEPITGKKAGKILADIVDKYSPEIATKTASLINREAFKMGTIQPVSFTPDSFIIPPYILEKKEKLLNSGLEPGDFSIKLEALGRELVEYLKSINDPAYDLVASGAKGSRINAMQYAVLLLAKGSSVDIEGNPSAPIMSSTSDGFSLEEFYTNAAEARAGLYIRSSGAALPGALARDVVYANSNIKLDTKKDCKTKRYLDLFVSEDIGKSIIGRYYLSPRSNKLEEIKDDHNLTGKTIKIRSPLHCISKKGVCPTCYGRLSEKLNTKYIGVMVGSIVNELLLGGVAMKTR